MVYIDDIQKKYKENGDNVWTANFKNPNQYIKKYWIQEICNY